MQASSDRERILVVDDAATTLEVLQRNLAAAGYHVLTATGVEDALGLLEGTHVDLVITDLRMPGASGMTLIRHVRENLKDTEVMVITGFATVEGAVQAIKMGAEDYLAKPFTDQELLIAVRRSFDKLHMRISARTRTPATPRTPVGLIGESEAMRPVFRAIATAARSSATVLISGESGTGKELVARAVHYGGPRASAPFVAVNCGAIPETLLESELFGHVDGAFPGASESRAGLFKAADGGTVFLDEIGDIPPAIQVKLLRVLQDKEISMVGASTPQRVAVRIVASTNRDSASLVEKGVLREDFLDRLNVIPIAVPPLRKRGDDILLLANHFARKFADESGKPLITFSESALRALREHAWPGNVLELENVVRGVFVTAESDVVEVSDLPALMRFSALRENGVDRTLAEVEMQHIRNVLASCGGNRTNAARVLGIDRKTLREKLKARSTDKV